MANNIDLTICALECPLGTFQCSGRLIFRKEYTVLFSPKRTTSRFASLSLRTPHRSPVSSPLAAAAALWLPCVRGAVRRRAGLRGCLRIRGKGKGRRPSPVSAPNQLFELCWCFARLIWQAETLELQPHSRPPSKRTALSPLKRSCSRFASLSLRTPHRPPVSLCFSPKRTTFRFASLTLRLRTETFFQKVLVFRMAYSAIPHHRPYGRWCFARLIRQAETLELQPHSRPPSKRTALSPLKRSCFSRFAASEPRTALPSLLH